MLIRAMGKGFKDGRYSFEGGRVYDVPERKSYFVQFGWAVEISALDVAADETVTVVTLEEMSADAPKAPAAEVTLDVQSVAHDHEGEVLGNG